MSLTVGSLFSGIGGLDLGLERAGMNVIWQSEIDPYSCRVLKKHWPEVPNHGDIKEINWQQIAQPDVICGGYPCQPFSQAGKRRGEEDPRHLWPWVREAISELRPSYAILENVRGHLSMGGLSVIGELAAIGYDAEWRVVSAASVGANHRRDRIVIVAYPDGSHSANGRQCSDVPSQDPGWRDDRGRSRSNTREVGMGSTRQSKSDVADSTSKRLETTRSELKAAGTPRNCENEGQSVADAKSEFGNVGGYKKHSDETGEWGSLQSETRTSSLDVADTSSSSKRDQKPHGIRTIFGEAAKLREPSSAARSIPNWWEIEPDVGRVAHGVPDRMDRLKGLGNAVVPQVAEVIGRLVMEHAA